MGAPWVVRNRGRDWLAKADPYGMTTRKTEATAKTAATARAKANSRSSAFGEG
jgi:hypothetical protein